jgi:hypothetical protein
MENVISSSIETVLWISELISIFEKATEQEKKIIHLKILLRLAFPNNCLTAMELVEGIADLGNVEKSEAKNY